MKKLIPILCLIPSLIHAADVRLLWDPNPVTEQIRAYHVYEVVGPDYVWLAEVTTNFAVVQVPPGVHTFTVTASNYWGESAYSLPATLPPLPSVPGNLDIDLTTQPGTNSAMLRFQWERPDETVIVQHSQDLQTWHDWLNIRQSDPDLYLSNYWFGVVASRPIQFWRKVSP